MAHPKTESTRSCEVDTDCATGKRNRFFRFKTMGAEEFLAEQSYVIARRRLINRSVHGVGVVAGYKLDGPRTAAAGTGTPSADDAVLVSEGLAFDWHGREVLSLETLALTERNTFLVDPANKRVPRLLRHAAPGKYLLRAHYAERRSGEVAPVEHCGCGPTEHNFVCETVVFSVEHLCCDDDCPCAAGPCDRECACGGDACCDAGRGPHACLCRWISDTKVPRAPKALNRWNGYWIDPCDGVGLACVTIARATDPCDPVRVVSIDDDCGPRRLVKNNDLLYDLLRGCDLTRVAAISWGHWHRNPDEMPWRDFLDLLGPPPSDPDSDAPVVSNFEVTFSGPVLASTVTLDCFAMRFALTHPDTGWYETRVVRILAVDTVHDPGDAPEYVRAVRLALDPDFYREIYTRPNKFRKEGATVEIEVRGDFILDCHEQAVDANAIGFALQTNGAGSSARSSGNGTPGGTLLSVFRIQQRLASTTS